MLWFDRLTTPSPVEGQLRAGFLRWGLGTATDFRKGDRHGSTELAAGRGAEPVPFRAVSCTGMSPPVMSLHGGASEGKMIESQMIKGASG